MSEQKVRHCHSRIFDYATSLGCIVENGKKHFKINFNGLTLLVISKGRKERYDIPAQERKLQRMINNVQT